MLVLQPEADARQLAAIVSPPHDEPLTVDQVRQAFAASPYREYRLHDAAIVNLVQLANTRADETHQVLIAEALDAQLTITVAADQMSATVSYTPAAGGSKLDELGVIKALKNAGVLKGIRSAVMQQLAANPPAPLQQVPIAEGKPPTPSVPGKLEYLVTTLQRRKLVPQVRDDGSLDMRELGGVETVAENQPVLRRKPPQPGTPGYTVTGTPVPAPPPPELALVAGDGTCISPDDPNLLLSTQPGVPIEIRDGLRIDAMLVLNHDIDLSVGNIDFRGSVTIKGDITHGMRVKATGDILIQGTVEPSHIEAGGNITITEGVLGSQTAENTDDPASFELQLRAGGIVSARHAQHAFIKAAGVQIGNELFHCLVQADGPVVVGADGARNTVLVGGRIGARKRIQAGVIGADNGTRTVLDFTATTAGLQEQLQQLQEQLASRNTQLEQLHTLLETRASALPAAQRTQLRQTHATLGHEVAALKQALETTRHDIDQQLRDIRIKVFGRLYPGTEVHVAGHVDIVRSEHGAGTFRLEAGRLVFDH